MSAENKYKLSAGFRFGKTPLVLSGEFGSTSSNKLTAEVGDLSMVDIVSYLISLFDPKGKFQSFPEPWGFLNNINFKGLKLIVEGKSNGHGENRIGFSYPFSIDVKFAKITALEIYYYTDNKKINIQPSGSFLGRTFEPWEIYPKQNAPKVPGAGDSLFELKFLGLGQHISVKDMVKSPGIADTIGTLRTSFKEGAKIVPSAKAKKGDLIFSPSSGWMIGTQFVVLNTVDLSIIYNDPYMYGLALSLSGKKAKTFAGLNVELLYKKVTDSIGVYSLHLKLPDAMRQLEFGAVSFTLPVIDIAIYSNGNFRVDLGFPTNNDWSRVATVQVFPFIGAGGFYFALLTGATATRLPADYDPKMGVFKPVIDFGIALRLGIGKTIDKGILKAGISLCFQGIVTGTYGFFSPDEKSGGREDSYYYLNGQFEVVGRVYGEVNFSIISARLDVMIYAAIGVVIEAYKDIILYINAGVSLSLTVSVNLGFVKINVDLSFSTSISYTFILPAGSGVPGWRAKSLRNAADASSLNPFYMSLVSSPRKTILGQLGTKRMLRTNANKPLLPVMFLPQFSARVAKEIPQPQLKDQTASFIAGLFLDSGDDDHAGDFGMLAKTYLEWLIAGCNEELKKDITDKVENVTIEALKVLFDSLSEDRGGVPVIPYRALTNFLYDHFDVQVSSPMESHRESSSFNVSIFPMLPDLKLQAEMDGQAPFINVDFSANPIDSSYNKTIREYFAKLKVDHQNPLEEKNNEKQEEADAVRQSLSTFIFQDYFVLLGRNLVQDCIDLMEAYPYTTTKNESLPSIIAVFKITAAAIVNANANVTLEPKQYVYLGGTSYSIQKNDSFYSIATYYNFTADTAIRPFLIFVAKDKANAAIINLFIPGSEIIIAVQKDSQTLYTCKTGDTLQSIAEYAKREIYEIVLMNMENENILSTFARLAIPKYEFKIEKEETFASLAAYGNISTDQLAENNAKNDTLFFKDKTNLVLPELRVLDSTDILIKGITEKKSFRKLAGLASRYLMHGLRAPAPAEFADKKDDTYALYELTQQLFDLPASGTAASCTITLSENTSAPANAEKKWFKVVSKDTSQNAIKSKIALNATELKEIGQLSITLLQPHALSVKKAEGYTINPGRFMLKAPSVWQANAPVFVQGPSGSTWPGGPDGPSGGGGWWPYSMTGSTGFSGPPGWQRAVAPKIWYFSDELTKAVQEQKSLEPLFRLYMGRNNMVEKKFEKKEVIKYGWSTVIPLNINIVPSVLTQGQDLGTMFEIESTSEEGLQLLEKLLANQYDPKLSLSERVDVAQVHVLYTAAESSDGDGLRSVDPSEVISAVVQSNLSTIRNPQSLRSQAGSVGRIHGSFNQDPVNNIRRLWEACSVRSGGFYLYYFDSNTKQGIPPDVFDEKGQAQINIVITYGLSFQYGYNFLNSMTLGEMVPENSYLFVESQERKFVIADNNTTVEKLLQQYRVTIDHLAARLGRQPLKSGVLEVRNIIFLLDSDEYTLEKVAKKFNVSETDTRNLNPGIEFKQGDAVRIPPVKHTVTDGAILETIASGYFVSVAGLLWANREQAIFRDLSKLQLTDQSQNKTSSIIPGTVSFNLLRENPEKRSMHADGGAAGATALDPQSTLQLNYNLLTFAVKENPSFAKSSYSMPVSPGNAETGASGPPVLNYQGVLPAFSYSRSAIQKGVPSYPAPEKNPYRGNGEIVQVNFDWQDLYGNRTLSPFNNPKLYPGSPYLNGFPQMIGYSDPLQSVLQWPSIGIDHLFAPKENAAALLVSLNFDAAGYQPLANEEEADGLIEKAQADLETYRKAIYQLSAKDVKARVSTSLDPKLEDSSELKPGLLNMMDGIFHYLSAFSAPGYTHLKVEGAGAKSLALKYRMSEEYISALNPGTSGEPNPVKDCFLPNDNFYLYYTLDGESLTEIAAKLKDSAPQFESITAEHISKLNPGVPEIPGGQAVIVIPDQRFENYETETAMSLSAIADKKQTSIALLKAVNPDLDDAVPAGKKILVPHFNCSVYTVQEGDTVAALAERFNIPVCVLNAVTSRHTWPVQAGKSIPVPDNDFILYTAKAGDTPETIAKEKWIAHELLTRINPALQKNIAAGTAVLIPKTPVPLTQSFAINFDQTLAPVLPLEVSLTISRQAEQVDEAFLDQPEVRISGSLIPPHLSAVEQNKEYARNTPASESASLLHYANSFEKTFADVKIATMGDKSASKNQLYAVRLHEKGVSKDKKMISYRFIKDDAVFYAPIPLATYPLSATFSIPQYARGQGFTGPCFKSNEGCIGATGAGSLQMAFQGMQLDNVAENLFESVDQLLQPELTKALVQVDGILRTNYRQQLLDAKKKIAEGYGRLVQPVLEETAEGSQHDASEALQQQMLQRLCNLYSIGTIVQLPVQVSAPQTENPSLIFGSPVALKDKNEAQASQVTFSSAQIKLQEADPAWMTFILNSVQPAKNKNLSVDLSYKPLAMEFNIHPIPGISDYNASQWLFFVKPLEEVPIGRIHVPVPLRDFPVPPTPLSQEAKGVNDDDTASLTLEETRQWQYSFTFRNPDTAAAQDLIYSSTLFNLDNQGLKSAANQPDLFLGLATWNVVGRDMMSDLLWFLPKLQPGDAASSPTLESCRKIIKSYLSVVDYVADAIHCWLNVRAEKYQRQQKVDGRKAVEFLVTRPEEKDKKDDFYIQLQVPPGSDISVKSDTVGMPYPALPPINGRSYKPTIKSPSGKSDQQKYFFMDEEGNYLRVEEAKEDPRSDEISVIFGKYTHPKEKASFGEWLDIMDQWNAWGGVYITRNQYLFEAGTQPTNSNFVYRTPVVRPYNASAPLLDYDTPFDIHSMLLPSVAQTFEEQLRNMLYNFFGEEDKTNPKIRLKLVWSYSYCINADSTDPDGQFAQYVTLPGGLIPPFIFTIPFDWNSDPASNSFACQLASVIREWVKMHDVPGAESRGRLQFDITAFSDLPDNKLPFYRLRNLFLNLSDAFLK
ncbi:MAG: hypothetical protein JWO44_238 [Bacteroidetes bacterium]|nr:hypothetical protein [Bacteroidota bacterium]